MLVGRADEQRAVEALLAGARLGQSGVLVLSGEAGIGKSALLEDAAARAEGFRLLRVTGTEAERDLPFAGLAQLLRPVGRARPAAGAAGRGARGRAGPARGRERRPVRGLGGGAHPAHPGERRRPARAGGRRRAPAGPAVGRGAGVRLPTAAGGRRLRPGGRPGRDRHPWSAVELPQRTVGGLAPATPPSWRRRCLPSRSAGSSGNGSSISRVAIRWRSGSWLATPRSSQVPRPGHPLRCRAWSPRRSVVAPRHSIPATAWSCWSPRSPTATFR